MEKLKEGKKPKEKPKLKILAAGDFHGNSKIAEELAERAAKEKVDLVILTGDLFGLAKTRGIIKPFTERKQKVVFVPGNWETLQEAEEIARGYNIKDISKHYLKYGNIGLFGIGNANWSLYPEEESAFKHLKKEHEKIKDLEKKILVSHMHAAGTKSELSGFPGSESLKKAVVRLQPDLFISGHIHELEGIEEKIGKTRVINVGRHGRIIEI